LIKQNPYISDTINLLIAIDVKNTKELTRYLNNELARQAFVFE
jgi:hypothetical protein